MRLILDAPYPRQHLPRLGWVALLVTGCAVLGLASHGWFTASYTVGGVGSAVLLYYFMRGEVGPTAWAAWSVEWIVERVCTATAWARARLGGVTSANVDDSLSVAVAAELCTAVEQRTCNDRERQSTWAIGCRLHGLAHTSLLRARLTSARATTAIR